MQNADRILFVISTELFTENSKKEFYEIIKNADVLDRTILVINKIDSVRPDIAIDLVDNVLDEIDDDGVVDSDNIDIVSMSAKLYLDGMRDNAEDMIEDSNIDALEKLLSNTKTEQYPLKRKCCQQIRLFDEFIAQIKNTEDSKLSDDQRRKIADNREKIRQEIKATKLACTEIIKNGLGECQNSLSGTIHDFIRDKNTTEMNDSVNRIYNDSVNNIREDINLQFNGLLQKCNMEFRNIEHINDIFKPFTEEMPQSVDSNSNHSNFSEEIKEMLFKGSEKINQLAKPVVVGEKKHWIKKNEKILSPKGGEGTALNKIIGKVPILKKMNNVAPGLAAVAESVEKHQIAINVGFIFVDIAKDIKESYDKASTEKKRKRIIDQANRKFDDVINGQKYRLMDIVRKQADALENNLDKILPQESDNPVAQIINEAEKSLDQIQDRMEKID